VKEADDLEEPALPEAGTVLGEEGRRVSIHRITPLLSQDSGQGMDYSSRQRA
jgi:hypothetical protein